MLGEISDSSGGSRKVVRVKSHGLIDSPFNITPLSQPSAAGPYYALVLEKGKKDLRSYMMQRRKQRNRDELKAVGDAKVLLSIVEEINAAGYVWRDAKPEVSRLYGNGYDRFRGNKAM